MMIQLIDDISRMGVMIMGWWSWGNDHGVMVMGWWSCFNLNLKIGQKDSELRDKNEKELELLERVEVFFIPRMSKHTETLAKEDEILLGLVYQWLWHFTPWSTRRIWTQWTVCAGTGMSSLLVSTYFPSISGSQISYSKNINKPLRTAAITIAVHATYWFFSPRHPGLSVVCNKGYG